jgi:cis-L-3-hydroxyproline dehydratase
MKITRIQAFTYDATYNKGDYSMSHGRVSDHQPSLVIRLDTDEDVTGWGETCPHGRTYLPSFFEGELAAVQVLAGELLGQDPCNHAAINRTMDAALLGSNPAKAVLDYACWDVLGKATGRAASELLGGRLQDTVPLFTALPVADATEQARFARAELASGVRVFQVKVGDDPANDAARVRAVVEEVGEDCTVLADANGGWSLSSAVQAVARMSDLPVRLEQPCRTLDECARLAAHTSLPIVLDECVVTPDDLVAGRERVGNTGINLKPSRVGGLTKARLIRDLAQSLGLTFTVDDTWGGSLTSAVIAALAGGAAPESLTAVTNFETVTKPSLGPGVGEFADGRSPVPTGPGLGIEVDAALLGSPLFDTAAQG